MYQVCPSCKKLISDYKDVCPYCGRKFQAEPTKPLLMWCNYCKINVTPKKPLITKSGDFNLLESIIAGDAYREYYLFKRAVEGNKPNENPSGLICPKCGRTDLSKERKKVLDQSPINILKMRLAKGEITVKEYEELLKALK